MNIEPYKGRSASGNVKYFSAIGPSGPLLIGVTFTNPESEGKREYQVYEINSGNGWTRKCPDTRDILLKTTGETFEGKRDRGKWLESVYLGTPGPKMITLSASISPKAPLTPTKVVHTPHAFKGTPIVQEGSFEVSIQGPIDLLTVTKRRGEQGFLRDFLMKGCDSLPWRRCS